MDDQAKSEQAQNEAALSVSVGMHLVIEMQDPAGTNERLEFDLVRHEQADFSKGLMSERAPLAQAIQGHLRGETISFVLPTGAQQTALIVNITPSNREPSPDVDRVQVLKTAKDKITKRESKQTALTAELHYGSVDPDKIEE